MTINANEKFINKIEELLPKDGAVSSKSYEHESAIELFYRFPYFSNVKQLLEKYNKQYSQYGIQSYTYSNGLIKLKSYYVLNGEYAINQIIVTDSLESNNAIIHIWNKYELKALQQFFIKSESPSSLFGFPCSSNEDRSIETNDTEVEIEEKVIGRFLKIVKNNSNIVYAEKYMPVNRISYWELMPEDLFANIELEILYRYNDKPAFAQLLDGNGKSLLEGTTYCASDYKNTEIIVNSVNCEVDAIVKKIATIITRYDKIAKEKNSSENNGIEKMHEVASRLTKEKSMELIANREEDIQQQMQEITEEEYQSEVLGMLEDDNYDAEDMILGPGYSTNLLNKNEVQEKKLIKKKKDLDESN